MISVNYNKSSALLQLKLNSATSNIDTVLERMATGYKINGARDDAANIFISENLKKQINSTNVLQQAAYMALDALSIVDSALNNINNSLCRIRDLTLQQMNEIYDENSQAAISNEINKQIENIAQILNKTNFNNKFLLDGSVEGMFIPIYDSSDSLSGFNIDDLFKKFDFLDILNGQKDLYFLSAEANKNYYANFEGQIFAINSNTNQQVIYNYRDGVINFVNTEGATATKLGNYDNSYSQLLNKEEYLTLEANQSLYVKSGNKVYELKNTNNTSQVAVFNNNDTGDINIISGEGIQKTFLYELDNYTNINTGKALELRAGSSQHIIFNDKLYKITSTKNQTLIFGSKNGDLNTIAGTDGVSIDFVADIKTNITTELSQYSVLKPNETKYYEYNGEIYKLTNTSKEEQNFIIDKNNNIKDANGYIQRTKVNSSEVKNLSSYTNPQKIDVQAGESYYIKSENNKELIKITAQEDGQIFFDLEDNSINSLKGASATEQNINDDYEDIKLNSSQQFNLKVDGKSTKTITIGNEIYTIENDGYFSFNKTFEYDATTKTIKEVNNLSHWLPSSNDVQCSYVGEITTPTSIDKDTTKYVDLSSGTSYVNIEGNIYEITNNGGSGEYLFQYNQTTGEISPVNTTDIEIRKVDNANFQSLDEDNFSSVIEKGESQYLSFTINGVEKTYKVTNNSDTKQSVIFDKNGGLSVTSGENIQIEEYQDMTDYTSIKPNSFYVDFNGETRKNIYVDGVFYEITNSSGTTAVFNKKSNNIQQYEGSTTTKNSKRESLGIVSNNSQYFIELNPNETKYIKIDGKTFKLENTTGNKQTQVFSIQNTNMEDVNKNIITTYLPMNDAPMQQMLVKVDWGLKEVLTRKASLGAVANILDASISRNEIVKENLTSAYSTIMDADFSEEVASLVKNKILKNTTEALLAQSNFAYKQNILALIT